jgi:hypothetical protein
VNGSYTINQAPSATVVTCTGTPVYNGAPQTPCTVAVTGAGGLSLSPTPVYSNNVNAGVNTASASYTFTGDTNHTGSSDTKHFSIAKAPVTATAGSGSTTYDGGTHAPDACAVSGVYTGTLVCANSPASVGPSAGTTPILPVVSGDTLTNFYITPVNGSYTINQASSATVVTCTGTPIYNGARRRRAQSRSPAPEA